MKHKNGSLVWILARGEALRNQDGRPYRMSGSHSDITKRKLAEHALQYERDLFAAGPVFSIEWMPQTPWPVRSVSANVTHILGYSPDYLCNKDFLYSSIIHPEDLGNVVDEVSQNIVNHVDFFEQS